MRIYLFILLGLNVAFLSCNEKTPQHMDSGTASSPEKIRVYRDNVYDLSGYANDGGNPFNLFDENAFVDPRSEKKEDNYIPTTNPQPTVRQSIYFPLHRGSRIVTDLRVPYKLSEIYIYDASHLNDSVWIYTGEMRHWRLKAALETKSDPGSAGWRKISISDSTQYVMIRFSSYETGITEMVLYGTPLDSVPAAPSYSYGGPRFPKKTMKEFLGANYIMETEPRWLQPFHYSRLYNFALDFDNDKNPAYPGTKYTMLHYGRWDAGKNEYRFDIDTLKKINNGIIWYSIRGVSAWMNDKGFTDKDRPVTKPGMDPEDPLSYARHANMMWNMAAFFGSTKVDTNSMSLSHRPRRSGRGTMHLFENGNEEDTRWDGSKYCSPVEYFAQSSADYDGHEHALGKFCGIINADTAGRLMTSGMIELDTNRVKVYKFLTSTLRKDKTFIWKGGIQYHHYSNKNNKAITPEEDSLRLRLTKVRECTYRIQPDVECFLGENGYDKSAASLQGTPRLHGLSASQSQGVMILRSINATAFSGFDAYILYWLKDGNPEDDPRVYLTSGILRAMPDGSTKPYPGWFYISSFVNRLANYYADTIISEKTNVWVYKYRNRLSPDSVAYFVYCPTRNGTKVDAYALRVGKSSGEAQEIDFTDNDPLGKAVARPIRDNSFNIVVEEKPKLVMLREN